MHVHPDAIRAALTHLATDWGETGYYVTDVSGTTSAQLTITHTDGSRFVIAANRHGVPRCPTSGQTWTWDQVHHYWRAPSCCGWHPLAPHPDELDAERAHWVEHDQPLAAQP